MTEIVIPDGGTIGSASDPDAISIASSGKPTFSQGIANTGTIDAGTLGSSVVVPASIGGSIHLIQKQSGPISLIEFTNLSNHSAFRHLMFIFDNVFPSGNNVTLRSRIATSGTSYLDASYHHVANLIERNQSNGVGAEFIHATTSTQFIAIENVGNASDDQGPCGEATLYNHQISTAYKRIIYSIAWSDQGAYDKLQLGFAHYKGNKDAFTAIKFEFSSGTIASGSISMYGIKDA